MEEETTQQPQPASQTATAVTTTAATTTAAAAAAAAIASATATVARCTSKVVVVVDRARATDVTMGGKRSSSSSSSSVGWTGAGGVEGEEEGATTPGTPRQPSKRDSGYHTDFSPANFTPHQHFTFDLPPSGQDISFLRVQDSSQSGLDPSQCGQGICPHGQDSSKRDQDTSQYDQVTSHFNQDTFQRDQDTSGCDQDTYGCDQDTSQNEQDTSQRNQNTCQADQDTSQKDKNTSQRSWNIPQCRWDIPQRGQDTSQCGQDTSLNDQVTGQLEQEGDSHCVQGYRQETAAQPRACVRLSPGWQPRRHLPDLDTDDEGDDDAFVSDSVTMDMMSPPEQYSLTAICRMDRLTLEPRGGVGPASEEGRESDGDKREVASRAGRDGDTRRPRATQLTAPHTHWVSNTSRAPQQKRTGCGDKDRQEKRTGREDRERQEKRTGREDRDGREQRTGREDNVPQEKSGRDDKAPQEKRTGCENGDRQKVQEGEAVACSDLPAAPLAVVSLPGGQRLRPLLARTIATQTPQLHCLLMERLLHCTLHHLPPHTASQSGLPVRRLRYYSEGEETVGVSALTPGPLPDLVPVSHAHRERSLSVPDLESLQRQRVTAREVGRELRRISDQFIRNHEVLRGAQGDGALMALHAELNGAAAYFLTGVRRLVYRPLAGYFRHVFHWTRQALAAPPAPLGDSGVSHHHHHHHHHNNNNNNS